MIAFSPSDSVPRTWYGNAWYGFNHSTSSSVVGWSNCVPATGVPLNTSYSTYNSVPCPSGCNASIPQITPPCLSATSSSLFVILSFIPPNNARNWRYIRPTFRSHTSISCLFSICWISTNCLCSCSCCHPMNASTSSPYVLWGRLIRHTLLAW